MKYFTPQAISQAYFNLFHILFQYSYGRRARVKSDVSSQRQLSQSAGRSFGSSSSSPPPLPLAARISANTRLREDAREELRIMGMGGRDE